MADSLKTRIQDDMKTAMRAKEALRLGTIRMLLAAIKQREIDERITLDDANVLSVINKMVKQRHDSATQFRQANRLELAEKEEQEIALLTAYLPTQLTDAEVDKIVTDAVQSTRAKTMKEMGAIMKIIGPKVHGRTDMKKLTDIVKSKLQ